MPDAVAVNLLGIMSEWTCSLHALIANLDANTVFAAIKGSSIASATALGKIASPEMIHHGCSGHFPVGTVAGSSVLSMLVPPSLPLIVYVFLAEQSVGQLFLAAMVPGLTLAVATCVMIWLRATFQPGRVLEVGAPDVGAQDAPNMSAGRSATLLVLVNGLIDPRLGRICGVWFTPTDGGAVGSAGALLHALVRRRIDARKLWHVLVETGQISTTVLFLILSANIFTIMLASSGFVQFIGGYAGGLGLVLWQFALVYVVFLVVLGMFLESVSIMLIVVPNALPTAIALGGDPIWFGTLTVIAVEVGLLTPPFGLTCFVVALTPRDTGIALRDIFLGALPFVWVMVLVTPLLILFPVLGSLTP